MHYEQSKPEVNNNLVYSVESNRHIKKILEILRSHLAIFAKDFIRTANKKSDSDIDINYEDYISGELSLFLSNKVTQSGYLFWFRAIGPDVIVHQYPHPVHETELFVIEAKRLNRGSRDYVSSGIGRFKDENHGKDHDIAAMLGYVQKEDFNYWHNKVNSWIDDLITKPSDCLEWAEQDKIVIIKLSELGEYKSTHSRKTKNPITLHHFWLNFCNRK